MTESPFLALAEQHDLDYASRVAPEASGSFPLPHGETTDLVGGALPGGREGLAARHLMQSEQSGEQTEVALVVTRIPESVGFARFIRCFEAGFRGPVARLLGPGGLGWIREYQFESIEFNRRYRIAMLRTGKENRLRQLFSPTFLDWMASEAPEGLYFDLVSGVLTVTLAGVPEAASGVAHACELAGHIAERIRSEALEGVGLDDGRDPQSDAARDAMLARYGAEVTRATLESPATDVASALERVGPAIKARKGFVGRLFGSADTTEARMLALTAVLRSYADRDGLECDWPDALHELLPLFDHFPMALMRQLSMRAGDSGSAASETLVAFADMTSMGSRDRMSSRPALEIETSDDDAVFVHVLPRAERDGPVCSAIGGFAIQLAGGARRETEASRREREHAEALTDSLGGRFDVVAHRRSGGPPVSEPARDWLVGGAGDGLVLERGRLTLVGPARPVIEWSFETLDDFRASVGPVVADMVSATGHER